MNAATQTHRSTQTQTRPAGNEFAKLLEKEAKAVEFVPFGASDPIRLTVRMVQDFIAVKTKQGKTCSDAHATRFIMLCQAQRLNPFTGDAFLVGYDGQDGPQFSLITAHQAFLKRAETCEDYEGMESGVILLNEDGTTQDREGDFVLPSEECVGGWAKVHRRNRRPTVRRLAIAAMKPKYETPFWSGVKAPGQIVKCAEADALRSTFPTLLGGLYLQEESDIGRIVAEATRSAFGMNVKPEPIRETAPVIPPPAIDPDGQIPGAEVQANFARTTLQSEPQAQETTNASHPTPTPAASIPAEGPKNEQEKLAKLVIDNGYTFNQFQAFVGQEQLVPDADSLSGFQDVPKASAARLLRNVTGFLSGLKQIKERGIQ